jgi:hypothetical protein
MDGQQLNFIYSEPVRNLGNLLLAMYPTEGAPESTQRDLFLTGFILFKSHSRYVGHMPTG